MKQRRIHRTVITVRSAATSHGTMNKVAKSVMILLHLVVIIAAMWLVHKVRTLGRVAIILLRSAAHLWPFAALVG